MSLKAAFHRAVCDLVRNPGARDELARMVEDWRPVLGAFEAGHPERARELVSDLQARSLLREALPDWEWRGE